MVACSCCVKFFTLIAGVMSCIKGEEVEFLSKPSNLTVQTGGTAIFPCKVVNLEQSHRVAWISTSSSKLLSIDGHTLSSNNHVIVIIDPNGGFELHINKVTSQDAGEYKCMVTTDPVMEHSSILHVTGGKYLKRKKSTKNTRNFIKTGSNVPGVRHQEQAKLLQRQKPGQ